MPVNVQMIVEYVQELKAGNEQLALIVGKPGSGKSKIMRELATNRGWKYIDCQLLISDELLELVPKVRSREAPRIFSSLLQREKADVILLDGMQVLFRPMLQIDPLDVLRQLSKSHVIVAAWPGQYDGGKLSFLEVGHPEPFYYDADGLRIIELG